MPSSPPDQSRRSGWKLIREAIRPHRTQVLIGVFAGLLWTVCKVSVPTLVRLAIDKGILPAHHSPGVLATWSLVIVGVCVVSAACVGDRKSTRLNSSHRTISYAVFCLEKK